MRIKKRNFFTVFALTVFISLILTPFVFSAESEFTKNSTDFDQGETLIVRISGNFVDQITNGDVFFYRDHERVPMNYEVEKISDDFYIYARLLDKQEGNYSLRVEGVRYILGTQTTDEDIIIPFTITDNLADFSINPGIVKTSGDFSLQIQNLKSNRKAISIESSFFSTNENQIELVSGEIMDVEFQTDGINESFLSEIELSSESTTYFIPVYFEFKEDFDQNEKEEEKITSLRFEPSSTDINITTDSDAKRIIYLVNDGEVPIENISLEISSSLNSYMNVSPSKISLLNEGSTQKIEIFINSSSNETKIEGSIVAQTEDFSTSFLISLNFIKDFISEEEEEPGIITTCEQLEGQICGSSEKCNGETVSTREGSCCVPPSICEEVKEKNTGKIIGWGLVVIILILLVWFFKKYKKARPKTDILSLGKKK
ncbi:MAG: hypothetical protein WDZ62_01760 [Candidatus Pacearchaeota archaeon]